jgi:hypothetical protein
MKKLTAESNWKNGSVRPTKDLRRRPYVCTLAYSLQGISYLWPKTMVEIATPLQVHPT